MSFQQAKDIAAAMRSNVNYDEFFIITKKSGRDDRRWSLIGIQFISEFITGAVRLAGLNPSQVTIRVGEKELYHDVISLAYPSPSTGLITRLTIKDGFLEFERRRMPADENWKDNEMKLNMADPNVQQALADIIKKVLPKSSKFMEKKT